MTRRLLLLHGFTGGPESWERVRAELPAGIDVLTPALVGHRGAPEVGATDFESEVDRLARSLPGDGMPCHLAGYSLGGRLALGLLARHPTAFVGATLVGAQPGLATGAEREERARADDRWVRLLSSEGVGAFVDEWERLPLFRTQITVSAADLAAQRATRLGQDAGGLVLSLAATGLARMPCYWDDLDRIRVPTTLVAGASDGKFAEIARRMAGRLPLGRVELVPGAGHNVLLERPGAIAAILRGALRAHL